MAFYEKVIKLCAQKGVSRTKMADEIGISESTPVRWEREGVIPRHTILKKIADYFKVPVEYLTNDEMEEVPTTKVQTEAPEMDDVLMFALLGGTDEKARAMWEKVKEYAEFLKATDK